MVATYDEQQKKVSLDSIIENITKSISMEDLSAKLNAKQAELDEAVKRMEKLDIEAQEKARYSYVR